MKLLMFVVACIPFIGLAILGHYNTKDEKIAFIIAVIVSSITTIFTFTIGLIK